jgi:phosphatidate phosphatase
MFFIWFFRILGYFLVGTLFCTLTTELAKYKIGRLRPYFLTVCKPDMSDAICKVEGIIKEFWSFEPTLF